MRPPLLLVAVCLLQSACEREARDFDDMPAPASTRGASSDTGLIAGRDSVLPAKAERTLTATARPDADPYGGNAFGTSEGKRLFSWMNCTGCHANGGGGIGPPLIDAEWRYGSAPADIYRTIAAGRPNGMPAYGDRLNSQQTWQLVAYVRALSAQSPKWVRPGREDHMQVKPSEQQTPRAVPVRSRKELRP